MKKKTEAQKKPEIIQIIQPESPAQAASLQTQPSSPSRKINKETVRQLAVEDEKIIKVIRALLNQDDVGKTYH